MTKKITIKQLSNSMKKVKDGYSYYQILPTRVEEYWVLTNQFPFIKKMKIGKDYTRRKIIVPPMGKLCVPLINEKQYNQLLKKGDFK